MSNPYLHLNVLYISVLPPESIFILVDNPLPLLVENIKSPLVSSAVPSWLPWICANALFAWSSNITFDSQPPSVFSLVLFFKVKYGALLVNCNNVPGLLSPTPTFPFASILILSVPSVLNLTWPSLPVSTASTVVLPSVIESVDIVFHDKFPLPSVRKYWPLLPLPVGNVSDNEPPEPAAFSVIIFVPSPNLILFVCKSA